MPRIQYVASFVLPALLSVMPQVASACSCSEGNVAGAVYAYETIVEATFVHIDEADPEHNGFPVQRARIRIVRAYKNEGPRQLHPGDEIEIVLRGCNSTPWPTSSATPRNPLIWFLSAPDPDYRWHFCDVLLGANDETRAEVLRILRGPAFRSIRRAR